MTSSVRISASARLLWAGAILGLCAVTAATRPACAARFGVFRNGGTQVDVAGLQYIGAEWTYRDIRPFSRWWWAAADSVVSSNCSAGMEVVFNLTTAPDSSLNATFPQNIPAWVDSVQRVVERYDGDGVNDMPGLTCPVKYWHVIEEDTFWKDETDQYLAFLSITRAAVKSADPAGQVVLMGISSDNCGSAAYWAGSIRARPAGFRLVPDDSLARFTLRTHRLLHEGDYDVVDVHCYELDPVLGGKIGWLRGLMSDPAKPIWTFEAGGPYETRAQGYTDTLNAYQVVRGFTQALANGAERFSQAYNPSVSTNWDGSESFQNVALRRRIDNAPTYASKPSYETYRLLTEKLAGYTTAQDQSTHDGTDEREDLLAMRFDTPRGPVYVAWCASGFRTLRLSAVTQYVTVTHLITQAGRTADDAAVEYLPVVNGVATATVGAEPVFIEGSDHLLSTDVPPPPDPEAGDAAHRTLLTVGPIPARTTLRLSWTSAAATPLHVTIATLDGRIVRSLDLAGAGGAAVNRAVWDLRDAHGHIVPAGVYVLAYRDEHGRPVARKVSVLR